jgi:hypothetical protein
MFRQVLFTKDYLVVKIGNKVLFKEIDAIFEQNRKAYGPHNYDLWNWDYIKREEIDEPVQNDIDNWLLSKRGFEVEFK